MRLGVGHTLGRRAFVVEDGRDQVIIGAGIKIRAIDVDAAELAIPVAAPAVDFVVDA